MTRSHCMSALKTGMTTCWPSAVVAGQASVLGPAAAGWVGEHSSISFHLIPFPKGSNPPGCVQENVFDNQLQAAPHRASHGFSSDSHAGRRGPVTVRHWESIGRAHCFPLLQSLQGHPAGSTQSLVPSGKGGAHIDLEGPRPEAGQGFSYLFKTLRVLGRKKGQVKGWEWLISDPSCFSVQFQESLAHFPNPTVTQDLG